MNSLQIECFLEVADCLSFTKAAEKLFVSQPAISKQISSLELELDLKLFERESKKTKLTPAGHLFYEFIARTKSDFMSTLNEINQLEKTAAQSLNISTLEGWDMSKYLPSLINELESAFSKVKITISCLGFKDMVHFLNEDKTDLIFTISQSLGSTKKIASSDIAQIDSLLVFSANHPLAVHDSASFLDFKDEVFFVPSSSGYDNPKAIVKDICLNFGFTPKIEFLPNIDSIIFHVENNLGVAILDEWNRIFDNPRLKNIKTGQKHTVSAAWKKGSTNPLIDLFVNKLSQLINS